MLFGDHRGHFVILDAGHRNPAALTSRDEDRAEVAAFLVERLTFPLASHLYPNRV